MLPGLAAANALLGLAVLRLAGLWAAGARRGGGDARLALLGVCAPIGLWALAIVRPQALWGVPLVLAVLCRWDALDGGGAPDSFRRAEEESAAAARADAAPDDGAARLALAEAAERDGRFDEALAHFEAAHRLSDALLPAPALRDARERVEAAAALAPRRREQRRLSAADAGFVALCVAAALEAPGHGVAAGSAWLAGCWLRRSPERF